MALLRTGDKGLYFLDYFNYNQNVLIFKNILLGLDEPEIEPPHLR